MRLTALQLDFITNGEYSRPYSRNIHIMHSRMRTSKAVRADADTVTGEIAPSDS